MGVFKHFLAICLAVAVLLSLPVSAFAAKIPPVRIDDMKTEMIALPEGDLADILKEYLEIIRKVETMVKENNTAYSLTGALHDVDEDGLPELYLMYDCKTGYSTLPSTGIYAVIADPTEGKQLQCMTFGLGDVTCGESGIFGGVMEKRPVIHCMYSYNAMGSPNTYAWDSIFSIGEQGLTLVRSLSWHENSETKEGAYLVDGSENEKEWQKIMDSVEKIVLMNFTGNNIEELKYQIANYVL